MTTQPIQIIRDRWIVTAHDDARKILRSVECRNVQCAVALETKLISDPRFADRWAHDADPKSPEKVKTHGLERPWRTRPTHR